MGQECFHADRASITYSENEDDDDCYVYKHTTDISSRENVSCVDEVE